MKTLWKVVIAVAAVAVVAAAVYAWLKFGKKEELEAAEPEVETYFEA